MPLGASITDGFRSSTGNGYRKDLRNMLTQDGFAVDMVGSRKSGDMTDNDNEGWSGYRVEQVQGKAELSVPSLQPNLFTINAGTNDCAQNYQVDTTGERMDRLLEYLWNASPNSTIILSTLLINLNENTEKRVLDVNRQYRELAERKAAEKKRIGLAEMHSDDGPQRGDMADDTHPDDGGYLKMAKIWYRSIKEAESKGFLQNPDSQP
jgi:lysophospholipase L1-like esterase